MPYRSKGTVRFASVRDRKLTFVPDDDHLVKDGNRHYAAFFYYDNSNDPDNPNPVDPDRFINLADANSRRVLVTLHPDFQGDQIAIQQLFSAIDKQMKVEIKVVNIVGDTATLIDID